MGPKGSTVGGPEEAERSLLADLLERSRLYRTTEDYLELMRFVARLRNFAPFILSQGISVGMNVMRNVTQRSCCASQIAGHSPCRFC
jgi:hypothetical protein